MFRAAGGVRLLTRSDHNNCHAVPLKFCHNKSMIPVRTPSARRIIYYY